MRLRRLLAIAKKELIQIYRDPFSLALAFLLPVVLMFIFGYAITFDVNNIKMAVYDEDRSPQSRQLIRSFTSSGYFNIVGYAEKLSGIDRYINEGRATVAVVISSDFSKNLKTGKLTTPSIEVIVDGSDSNTATIAIGYISTITGSLFGLTHGSPVRKIDLRLRVWYNPELKSRNSIIPGLIAVIMIIISALLTSLTVAREWERGTMEQLISTPIRKSELIAGKVLPYFLIGFIDMLITVGVSVLVFDVPLKGSVFLIMSLSGVFLFAGLSLGIFISIATKSQVMANQIAMVQTFLPSYLLSGFMYAITNMPPAIQVVTYLVPARYFIEILKGIFLKGNTLRLLFVQVILLFIYGMFVFIAANRKFKKLIT
ncbi:MAG: ABC transporter permease [Nitrospirae bacterium]|nr:ABC transporter permease [Nitrospirota bacterium]